MDSCEVLIVGGGPAGSSCARRLREAGIETVILDKATFPRDKVCGGWITPAVVEELEIDLTEYARGRVLQPITGFRISRMGDADVETDYGQAVSYGVRRFEFDDYLLRRSGAWLILGKALSSVERAGDEWIVNGQIRARMLIGAGGHFCPVARHLGASARKEEAVAAQEIEFEMSAEQREACAIRGDAPELYFCADLKGYGWCFRKGDFLNIGLGRLDAHSLPRTCVGVCAGAEEIGEDRFRSAGCDARPRLSHFSRDEAAGGGRWSSADRRCGGAGVFAERRRDTAGD